jgi:hypothetical protein
MRTLCIVLVMTVSMLMLAREALAVPNVYKIFASGCERPPESRSGTAFVVKKFQPPQTPIVLVTALHVIYSCSNVGVYDLGCNAASEDKVRDFRRLVQFGEVIEIWKEWDLAVIRIPDPDQMRLEHPVTEELDFETSHLDRLKNLDETQRVFLKYHLPGTSEAQHCMHGGVDHTAVRKASAQYSELARREAARRKIAVSVEDMLGSLSAERWLLDYHGDISGGASGSPVTEDGQAVIAIHEGGFVDRESGWGVVIAGSGLKTTEPVRVKLGETPWRGVNPAYLVESAPDSITALAEGIKKNVKRLAPHHLVSLGFGFDARNHAATEGPSGYELSLGYGFHPLTSLTRWGYRKIGFVFELKGGTTEARNDYFSPSGEPLETGAKHLRWYDFAGGIDVRLDRLQSWISPSLSAGVLAGGWIYNAQPAWSGGSTNWNIGFWASLKNRWAVFCPESRRVGCIHLVLGLDASTRYTPAFDYQYTGIYANARNLNDDTMIGYIGLSIGVELGVDP